MKYFTSDLHLGESRIGSPLNLFYRPFSSIDEQNETILKNLQILGPEDDLYIIGDLFYDIKYSKLLYQFPPCKKILIVGNYDEKNLNFLEGLQIFDDISDSKQIVLNGNKVLLNHYPTVCKKRMNSDESIDFSITGHVHSLWKVQPKMINVSTDAWHFRPVSETEILFCFNAMENYYDENVFPYIDNL